MSRFAPPRKPSSSSRLAFLDSSTARTDVPTLAVPLQAHSRHRLGPFLAPRPTSPATSTSPTSSRASSPASVSSTGSSPQPRVSPPPRHYARATSYSHEPSHSAVPSRIRQSEPLLSSSHSTPESMVNVLQRKIGMNFKRVTSVPASNASSASEDAAISSYLSLRRSDRAHAQSTVKRYRDLRRLSDAELNKDLFNDAPDSPVVIGEDSDDDEVSYSTKLPPGFELKEQEWLRNALQLRVKVMQDGKFNQENPVYIQAVSRHQAQDQLVAASRHKLSAPNGARVAQSPSDAIFSDQDSESDVTTPPSSALPTPQHLTTEMPEVDFMEEFNYKCE